MEWEGKGAVIGHGMGRDERERKSKGEELNRDTLASRRQYLGFRERISQLELSRKNQDGHLEPLPTAIHELLYHLFRSSSRTDDLGLGLERCGLGLQISVLCPSLCICGTTKPCRHLTIRGRHVTSEAYSQSNANMQL